MKDGHCNGEIVLEFLSVRKIELVHFVSIQLHVFEI